MQTIIRVTKQELQAARLWNEYCKRSGLHPHEYAKCGALDGGVFLYQCVAEDMGIDFAASIAKGCIVKKRVEAELNVWYNSTDSAVTIPEGSYGIVAKPGVTKHVIMLAERVDGEWYSTTPKPYLIAGIITYMLVHIPSVLL